MMQTDVKSTTISGSASDEVVFAGPSRIKGMVVTYPAGPAALTLKNGSGGTTMFTFTAPNGAGAINILIPGEGIRCDSGIYATTTSGVYVTVFYG